MLNRDSASHKPGRRRRACGRPDAADAADGRTHQTLEVERRAAYSGAAAAMSTGRARSIVSIVAVSEMRKCAG
jgi:hypothetical protein